MEILNLLLIQVPIVLGALSFLVVSILRLGKEQGAPLVLVGAIGIFLMVVANPIWYGLVIPKVVAGDPQRVESLLRTFGFLSSTVWGISLILVAIGAVMRGKSAA